MTIAINAVINEGSTFGLSLTLHNSAGEASSAEAIANINWWLFDSAGVIVNNRSSVSAAVTNPVMIKLEPADTKIAKALKSDTRFLTVSWTYNDTELGQGTVNTEEYKFVVSRVRGQ